MQQLTKLTRGLIGGNDPQNKKKYKLTKTLYTLNNYSILESTN